MKSYDHLNISRVVVVHLLAFWYIMGLTHTPTSIVMDVWIGPELPCSISSVSIYYVPESKIRVKIYDLLNFLIAFVVHFRASRYMMGLNHTIESKVTIVWICLELSYSISTVSIYYALESDIRVKNYDLLNFLGASIVHFLASRYITSLKCTPESIVITVLIGQELPCSISSISVYYVPESDIQV